jgi:hypothetical protein
MPHPRATNVSRHASSGAIRPGGLAAATLTAAAVFILGLLILPPIEPEAPPPPPPAPVEPPPPPPPPPPPADASSGETPQSDAEPAAPDPSAPAAEAPASPTAKAKAPPAAAAVPDAGRTAAPEAKPDIAEAKPAAAREKSGDKTGDKEVAREAWRKNLPDISSEPGKSTIIIPIKGSIEGATYHVTAKPKSVLVTLPKGESMITMPFYNLRRDGYRQLWIKKDEATGTTTMRIVLGEASDPQVEIKDDFVRVVVRRLVEAPAAAPAPEGAAPAATPEPSPSPARD